ncbi:MAG: YbjN domain-containing protein [Nitrospinota bacterium]
MSDHFEKVKGYLTELGFEVASEDEAEEIIIINDESQGIKNLIIDCEHPILVLEQFIFELKKEDSEILKRLLQMNREMVHGSFVLEETGKHVLFRDTLQLENLDLNELEGSIKSLTLALAEFSDDLINFAKS